MEKHTDYRQYSITAATIIIYRLQKLRNQKARQLLEAQKELKRQIERNRCYEVPFLRNTPHEFRTPLSLILGPIEDKINHQRFPTQTKKVLGLVKRNTSRLLDLVNQLLDLSKLEVGKMELNLKAGVLLEFRY